MPSSQSERQSQPLCGGSYWTMYGQDAVTKRGPDGHALRAICPYCRKDTAINVATRGLRAHRRARA